jgi:DNA modification methylase
MALFPRTGVIYRDDNLARLQEFAAESIDLIYLDPPFFSNRHYEVIWGDESEIRSFKDRWKGGIGHYIGWMKPRLAELHRILRPTGSLYLHCDPHASHYLKVAMDRIFGQQNFRNEIVWKRTGAHSGAKGFGPVHDTLLLYSRSDDFYWKPQRGSYDPQYVRTKFTMADPDGRRFQPISLTPQGTRKGETGKPWRGIDPTARGYHWKYPPSRLDELDAQGLIYWPAKKDGMPRLKFYLDEAPGMLLQDVWTDVPPVNARARERLGYPTQKPEALLERIIAASSRRGDIVLDPFCGCGTALAVAHQMKRSWIGIDISPSAIVVMQERLAKLGVTAEIVNGIETVEDLRALKPREFENFIIKRVYGTRNTQTPQLGIDGFSFMEQLPIEIKQQDRVGRPVVDKFESAIKRYGTHKGYIIAFSFSQGAYEEAARVRSEGLEIALVGVESLFEVGRDIAPRPSVSQLEADLYQAVRVRLASPEPTKAEAVRPTVSVEELAASDQT